MQVDITFVKKYYKSLGNVYSVKTLTLKWEHHTAFYQMKNIFAYHFMMI